MKCKKCKFFKTIEGIDTVGTCHRYPPRQDGSGVHTIDIFPTVRSEMWCGEFKKGVKK